MKTFLNADAIRSKLGVLAAAGSIAWVYYLGRAQGFTQGWWILLWLVGGLLCAIVANSQGRSPWFYGLFGLGVGPGVLPVIVTLDNSETLSSWAKRYLELREFILLTSLAGLAALAWLAYALEWTLIPSLVCLFEGMSLKLPWPTQALIFVHRWLHGPCGQFCCLMAALVVPNLVRRWTDRWPYHWPALGPIWKATDAIWAEQTLQDLPMEVVHRLGQSGHSFGWERPATAWENPEMDLCFAVVRGVLLSTGLILWSGVIACSLTLWCTFWPFGGLVGDLG